MHFGVVARIVSLAPTTSILWSLDVLFVGGNPVSALRTCTQLVHGTTAPEAPITVPAGTACVATGVVGPLAGHVYEMQLQHVHATVAKLKAQAVSRL